MFDQTPHTLRVSRERLNQESSLVDAARTYLACGWSIIPLDGKQPALASWKEFQFRRPTREEVTCWFHGRTEKPSGVGVVTGKLSGVVVVDCDAADDVAYWLSRFPSSPLIAQTGRGGAHIYYETPPDADVHNRVKIHRRSIDVRGEGGYVAAPPSRHPSGKLYAWREASNQQEALPLLDPLWLTDPEAAMTNPRSVSCAESVRNVAAYITRIHATSGEGGHNATFRAACKLRDAGLSEDEALAILREWNVTNAHPAWEEKDLAHKIRSAFKALTR